METFLNCFQYAVIFYCINNLIHICYGINYSGSGTLDLNKDNGWSKIAKLCIGYTNTYGNYNSSWRSGMVNITLKMDEYDYNNIYYLLMYNDLSSYENVKRHNIMFLTK